MRDLIERVKNATEGSRELDTEVCVATGDIEAERARIFSPPVTSSLDAATALCERVLPGWWWRVGTCNVSDDATIAPDYNCPVHGERLLREFPLTPHEDGCGGWLVDVDQRPPRSVALALCLAILTALSPAPKEDTANG